MRCIKTTFRGPSLKRGATITASCDAGRITVPYDRERDGDCNHEWAANELAAKFGWQGLKRHTSWYKGDGYHVFELGGSETLQDILTMTSRSPTELLAYAKSRGASAQTTGEAAHWALGYIQMAVKLALGVK